MATELHLAIDIVLMATTLHLGNGIALMSQLCILATIGTLSYQKSCSCPRVSFEFGGLLVDLGSLGKLECGPDLDGNRRYAPGLGQLLCPCERWGPK